MNFYVVAATIIPVLFLALIYQANVMEEYRDKPALMAVTAFVYVAYAVWGEATALHVLALGHAPSGAKGSVELSRVFVGGALAASPLVAAIPHVLKAHPNHRLVFALCTVGNALVFWLGLRGAGVV